MTRVVMDLLTTLEYIEAMILSGMREFFIETVVGRIGIDVATRGMNGMTGVYDFEKRPIVTRWKDADGDFWRSNRRDNVEWYINLVPVITTRQANTAADILKFDISRALAEITIERLADEEIRAKVHRGLFAQDTEVNTLAYEIFSMSSHSGYYTNEQDFFKTILTFLYVSANEKVSFFGKKKYHEYNPMVKNFIKRSAIGLAQDIKLHKNENDYKPLYKILSSIEDLHEKNKSKAIQEAKKEKKEQ